MKSNMSFDLEKQLSRLGNEIQQFVDRLAPLEEGEDFAPLCDIIESDTEFSIYLDLPGMKKEDVNLALKDNVLTVKGERRIELEEGQEYRRTERSKGAFSRSFAIPEDVNTAETKASFSNGVLMITMPKTDITRNATTIPID